MTQDSATPRPAAADVPAGLGVGPHKAADDTETIYFEGSPRLRGEVGKMILCTLIAAGIAVACWYVASQGYSWAWLGLIAALGVLLIPLLMQKAQRYRITNYRIDFERGLLGKKIDTMELWHVEDIQFRQSFVDRILGVGTVVVMSHDDTTPRLDLDGLPDARTIFDALKQRVIAVKRQRGVVKMDVGGHGHTGGD